VSSFERRARRARFLSDSYPACREILTFYAGVADWQESVVLEVTAFDRIPIVLPSLRELVRHTGSPTLAETAREAGADDLQRFVREYWIQGRAGTEIDPLEFFARAALQVYAAGLPEGLDCPWCSGPPQAGCLTPQGDGQALRLVCPVCLRRRSFPRTQCPACRESSESKLASFTTAEYPHLRLLACETCHAYLLVADLSRDPAAIPEVDELAALPLDLWAAEQGYHKLQHNLAGI
jgi:FdhE protein